MSDQSIRTITVELSENDIREAIAEWANNIYSEGFDPRYVQFDVREEERKNGHVSCLVRIPTATVRSRLRMDGSAVEDEKTDLSPIELGKGPFSPHGK